MTEIPLSPAEKIVLSSLANQPQTVAGLLANWPILEKVGGADSVLDHLVALGLVRVEYMFGPYARFHLTHEGARLEGTLVAKSSP